MSDNPWTAEVHMEAGTNGTDHAVWLYERQTYIAKPVHGSIEKCERFAARINGTNQPTHAVRADLLDGTNLIRHWLVGRTVDSVGLAAELRQWADTFQPLEDQPTDLPDGVSPWLGDEADAVALGRIVQTLPDDEWERSLSGRVWFTELDPNAIAMADRVYLLRRKPQTVTVELPKDVAEWYVDEGANLVAAPRPYPIEVRPPQEPPTVRVPWWEALVNHEFHGKVLSQHADPEFKGRPFEANCAAWVPDEEGEPRLLLLDVDEVQWAEPRADGTVEVLA